VNQQSAALVPHRRQHCAFDADNSGQIHFEHLLKLFDGVSLGNARSRNPRNRIIDDHVDASGALKRLLDRSIDGSIVRDVHVEDVQFPGFLAGQRPQGLGSRISVAMYE
jgi:hypothetical protein